MQDDLQLLRNYVENGSEESFRSLVEQHSGMVHGLALRILRNSHRAEEVTQATFIILARKGSTLRSEVSVAGWLYRTAHYVALEALRGEQRRQQRRELLADMNTSTDSVWVQIAPILDDALSKLSGKDRDAIVLRFLEEKSFAHVAQALGTTEAAAKMRISRALDKLRSVFTRQGIAIPSAALGTALSSHVYRFLPRGYLPRWRALPLRPPRQQPVRLEFWSKQASRRWPGIKQSSV